MGINPMEDWEEEYRRILIMLIIRRIARGHREVLGHRAVGCREEIMLWGREDRTLNSPR